MGYPIIFQTKLVLLSDGRLLFLTRSGCNNDREGRTERDWRGKIYSRDEFNHYADHLAAQPEGEGFDLKLRSKYITFKEYGKYLQKLRITSWEDLQEKRAVCQAKIFKGVEILNNTETIAYTAKEWLKNSNTILANPNFSGPLKIFPKCSYVTDIYEIIEALDNEEPVSFHIGKKKKINRINELLDNLNGTRAFREVVDCFSEIQDLAGDAAYHFDVEVIG